MSVTIPRRVPKGILALLLLVIFSLLFWRLVPKQSLWLEPAQFHGVDLAIADAKKSYGNAYASIISRDDELVRLEALIFVIAIRGLLSERDVKDDEPGPKRPQLMMARILEYLLIEYPQVVLIDISYRVGRRTLPKVWETVAKRGEVVVPVEDYIGRTSKTSPLDSPKPLPLIAYTREGFVEKIKPVLDCQRGVICDSAVAGIQAPTRGSILRRSDLELQKTDPRLKSLDATIAPFRRDTFQYRNPQDEEMVRNSKKIKIGLGLVLGDDSMWTLLSEDILRNYDREHYLLIIYLIGAPKMLEHSGLMVKVSHQADVSYEETKSSALSDGCEQFYLISQDPKELPRDWLKRLLAGGALEAVPLVLVVSVKGEDEIWMLRETIGSIHGVLYDAKRPIIINIFGSGISRGNREMIQLWANVEYYDMETALFGSNVSTDLSFANDNVRLAAMETIVNKFGHAVWISSKVAIKDIQGLDRMKKEIMSFGLVLARMKVDAKEELVVEGYDAKMLQMIHGDYFACLKGIICTEKSQLNGDYASMGLVRSGEGFFSLQSLLPKPSEDKRSQNYCHLSLRPEIMYNPTILSPGRMSHWAHGEQDAEYLRGANKTKIAFLVPAKNKPDEQPEQIHFVQTLLKSMLKSITHSEWNRFQYTFYIGYDRDDPIFDKRRAEIVSTFDAILRANNRAKHSVLFKFHLLPTAKCITLLWNILFVDAIGDGNDYFYQVNDDVNLESPGWSTLFVQKLKATDGLGVVGPNDRLWDCRLLTQSFVSRLHHQIFHWYFPTSIKDWYSDNWITSVYGGELTQCVPTIHIRNGASGTRYNICNNPKWREEVIEGQKRIARWKRQTQETRVREHEQKIDDEIRPLKKGEDFEKEE